MSDGTTSAAAVRRDELVASRTRTRIQQIRRLAGETVLLLVTCASAGTILFILGAIFWEALPFFRQYNPALLFRNDLWRPTADPAPSFGALGIFLGSALVTIGSCIIALPLGISAAVCLSDVVPFNVRQVAKPVIELLAAIPSVVYGFFALVLFAPVLQKQGGALLGVAWWILALPVAVVIAVVVSDLAAARVKGPRQMAVRLVTGGVLLAAAVTGIYAVGGAIFALKVTTGVNALNASIILALMALPTVVSVCEDALNAVGRSLREGSYALGATRAETMVKVVIPAAKGGIVAAIILGVMRAVGETMVVLMAAGNSYEVPEPWFNFLSGIRTLTATVALEMGETVHGGDHYHALFALAFCLLLFTFLLNLVSEWLSRRTKI